jgi:restriction system protein
MRITFGRSRRRRRVDPRVLVLIGVAILYGAALILDWFASHPAATAVVVIVLPVIAGFAVSGRLRRWSNQRFWKETIPELLTLTPSQFEVYVGSLLHDLGYRKIRQVGRAGDLAADLLCFDREGRSVVVQCKRYAPGYNISSPEIQMFIGMQRVQHRTERAMFVTTSDFTAPARKLAQRHGITLIDGFELTAYVQHENMTRRDRNGRSPLRRIAVRVAGIVTRARKRRPTIVSPPPPVTRPAPVVRITVIPPDNESRAETTPIRLPIAELPPHEVPSQPSL